MSKDIEQISAALQAYQDAVNDASAEDTVRLFTQDAVVMPQHSVSCVGISEVHKTFEGLFESVKFDVKFEVQEIIPVSLEYAFARANSTGTTVIKDQENKTEANQMLFIFRKVGGEWKIARYCFSSTSPPPG